jgi:hypothetical protein
MAAPGIPKLALPAARSFIAVAAVFYFFDLFQQTRDHLTNGGGRPFGDDFINFWSGAFLAWHGRASEIYNIVAFHNFELSVAGAALDGYHYSYPPVLLLLTLPLAFVPYVPGLPLWLIGGWYAFCRVLRAAMREGGALLLALAAPAVFINAIGGQNGTWTAALLGGGLIALERRPVLAGILFGLMAYKPQLGILVPVALLAGRHWRATAAAAATVCVLVGASIIVFGVELWHEYLRNVSVLRGTILEDGEGVWHRFVSVFVAARRLGVPVEAAYLLQMVSAVIVAAVVAAVWYRDRPAGIKNAMLLLATCLATPYLQDYDLVFTTLAIVWLWQEMPAAARSTPLFQTSAGLVLVLPLVAAPFAKATGLAFGPLFIVPLFVVAVQAGLRNRSSLRVAPAHSL